MARMKSLIRILLVGALAIGLASPAWAALINRGSFNDGMGGMMNLIYDDDLNITWLGDANFGAGSTFDDGISTTDGFISWQNAVDWAASLTVGGFSDWRLPKTLNPDPSCEVPAISFGLGCTGSEMGHLFNVEGVTTLAAGPFANIQGGPGVNQPYWSGTDFATDPNSAVWFNFNNGQQRTDTKPNVYFAWAVRDGDVFIPTCVSPPADLVSWWPGDSDASDIQDGNDGVLTNGAVAGVPGKVDGAFSFDGVDHFIRVTTSTNLNPGSLTIEGWVNPSSFGTGNLAMIVSKFSNPDLQRSYFLSVDNAGFGSPGAIAIGFITAAGTTTFVSGPTIPLNQFTHVAMTYDAATSATKIYINAVAVSKTLGASGHVFPSGSIVTSTTDVSIGAQIGGFSLGVPTRFWDGILDEIQIFNRALSATEIQAIFDAGSAGKCKGEAIVLLIDEDSINNGIQSIEILSFGPPFCGDGDPSVCVNDDIADPGVRQLLFTRGNDITPFSGLVLPTGEVEDEGLFRFTNPDPQQSQDGSAPFTIQEFIFAAGAAGDENNLDKIDGVLPLSEADILALVGKTVCAVVYDSDLSPDVKDNYASLKGATLGLTAFTVTAVGPDLDGPAGSLLPQITVALLPSNEVVSTCEQVVPPQDDGGGQVPE